MSEAEIRRSVQSGCEVFSEGARGDCAYIIASGAVEISTRRAGEKLVLAERREGEIFGEMAIVDDEPRSATVTAIEDSVLLVLSRDQLQQRIKLLDPVMRMVLSVVLDRFRDSMRWVRSETRRDSVAPVAGDAEELIAVHRAAIERITLEQSLKHAIADGQLTLFYQPIVASRSGRTAGYEALARWRHPEKGVLAPGAFIAVAEESGLIRRLSEWAVADACKGLAEIRRFGACEGPGFVSVNVTAPDICDPSFFDYVRATLAEAKLEPGSIILEITESMLMSSPDLVLEMLGRYRDIGVPISIDDFGAGYSNLTYLARYPVQTLKIDKGFIDQLDRGGNNIDVVKMMITLGETLGLKTVAEGVESEAQAELLKRLGCDYLQGFHYSPPVPLELHLGRARRTEPVA